MNTEDRKALKKAAQSITILFCEIREQLKVEYGYEEKEALSMSCVLITLLTHPKPTSDEEIPDTVDGLLRKFGLDKGKQ